MVNNNHDAMEVLSRPVMSFREVWQGVRQRLEVECFSPRDKNLAEELALVVAETYRMPKGVLIRICGERYPAGMVAEVYDMLTHSHIEAVIERYRQVRSNIRYIKDYQRSALYNIVFELEARVENELAVDGDL